MEIYMVRRNLATSLIFAALLLSILETSAQTTEGLAIQNRSEWKGFEKHNFELMDNEAWLVIPDEALPGNPWLWRARFPGYHSEADSILVSEGFHLAYINTGGMFGNPESMEIWDDFYTKLTDKYLLDKKVALAGVSRGGLFIYSWAKRNPAKVHCIYGDAPVCDFKSWPGGFGVGKGNPETWELLKEKYGFTSDAEAKAYSDNPIDNLSVLVDHKIPILHMVSLKDEIVPAAENTIILINNYIELGGAATVVPCTTGKQTLFGHHFPIETPRLVADFIKYNSLESPKVSVDK